jgi:hypothetical protein
VCGRASSARYSGEHLATLARGESHRPSGYRLQLLNTRRGKKLHGSHAVAAGTGGDGHAPALAKASIHGGKGAAHSGEPRFSGAACNFRPRHNVQCPYRGSPYFPLGSAAS